MRATEAVDILTALIDIHGDQEMYLDVSAHGLLDVGEIDVDTDGSGIIIWPPDGADRTRKESVMVVTRVKEFEGFETVGALREALLDLPEDMPLAGSMLDPPKLTVYREAETGDEFAEIE